MVDFRGPKTGFRGRTQRPTRQYRIVVEYEPSPRRELHVGLHGNDVDEASIVAQARLALADEDPGARLLRVRAEVLGPRGSLVLDKEF